MKRNIKMSNLANIGEDSGSPFDGNMKLRSQYCGREVEVEEEKEFTKDQSYLRGVWNALCSAFKPVTWAYIREGYRQLCISSLVNANVIEYSDVDILMGMRGQLHLSESTLKWCLVKKAMQDVAFAVLPAFIVSLIEKQTVITRVMALAPSVAMICSWKPTFSWHIDYIRLKKYLGQATVFDEDVTRAIELIKEMALVNQGYQMCSKTWAHSWKLETPSLMANYSLPDRSLPGLRIAVLETTSRLAVEYSSTLRMERKLRPLPYNLDHPLLCSPLVEDLDDNCEVSVPSMMEIKKSFKNFVEKKQEYFWRILLDLVSHDQDEMLQVVISENLFTKVLDAIKEIRVITSYYRTVKVQCTSAYLRKPGECNTMRDSSTLQSVCHITKGHLKEAWRALISMENAVDDLISEALSVIPVLDSHLHKANFHVDSTKDCLHHVSILVAQMKIRLADPSDVDLLGKEKDKTVSNEVSDIQLEVSGSPSLTDDYEVIDEYTVSEHPVEDISEGSDAAE